MSSGAPDHSAMITFIPIHLPGVDPPVRGTGTLGPPLEQRQVLEAAVESPVETRSGVPRTKTRGLQAQHAVETKTSPSDVGPEELGHWGGYTYRLCKLPEEGPTAITEECFSKNILKF